ncbi:MAG: hypothetical protein R3291_02035 [Thermoplasmata archaeon]|nr:hypothetical protein [Thermoplasmata archaeon]
MPDRCPRCRVALENPSALVCPHCNYALRLPAVGKVGAALLGVGLVAFLVSLFLPEELWVNILLGGTLALVLGMVAIVASGILIGRARARGA